VLLALTLIGLGVFYGAHHLKQHFELSSKENASPQAQAQAQTRDAVTAEPEASLKSKDPAVENRATIPDEPVRPKGGYPDAVMEQAANQDMEETGYRFLPRRELVQKEGGQDDPTAAAADDLSPPVVKTGPDPVNQEMGQDVSSLSTERPPAFFQKGVHPGRHEVSSLSRSDAAPDVSQRNLSQPLLNDTEKAAAEKEGLLQAKIDKCAKISQVVAALEDSVRYKDDNKVHALVGELEVLKGKDSHYISKMKAFLLIQKGDYESAVPILEKVLHQNKHDIEAGVNMAIIEARTNQREAAKNRLTHLSKLHPDNTHIVNILKRLD